MRTSMLILFTTLFSINTVQAAPGSASGSRSVFFKLECFHFNPQAEVGIRKCKVGSTFEKKVSQDGWELIDDSVSSDHPTLDVNCEGWSRSYSAKRFTNLLGTRLQNESDPFPSLGLPRGVLHSGNGPTSGNHVSTALLEIEIGAEIHSLPGVCYIWTNSEPLQVAKV